MQTKPLERIRHEELVQQINMMSLEEYLALLCLVIEDGSGLEEALMHKSAR